MDRAGRAILPAVRIVGGTLGGRVLRAPAGHSTRPTSEKVREAIFNILPDVEGARVLDIFAGSGAMASAKVDRRSTPAAKLVICSICETISESAA